MNAESAFSILDALAGGADPTTGEALPGESVLHRREVIRALQMAQDALWQMGARLGDAQSDGSRMPVATQQVDSSDAGAEAQEHNPPQQKPEAEPAAIERGLMLRAIEEAAEQSEQRLSPTALARWLLGRGNGERTGRTFGALRDQYDYPAVKATTQAFFQRYPELVEPRLRPWEDEPVALDPVFNRLSDRAQGQLRSLIDALPNSRARSGASFIQAARERYPRAFQPWTKEESRLLERAIAHTNDLQFLSRAFGRTQASLLEQIKRIRYRQRTESDRALSPRDRHPAS